jgi:CubicO group peptidase (beta-lactamase class C family)
MLLFIIILHNPIFAQVSQDSIYKYVSTFKNDLDLVSVSIVMVKDQKIVWKGAVGKSNIENGKNITTKQIQALGSVSKLFTGATLLKLYEEGKLSLDDDVDKYLPFSVRNPKFPRIPITIRMLLTHSSSIGDYQELQDSLYSSGDPTMSLAGVTNKFFNNLGEFYRPENFMDFEPGTAWEYSNWNFVLIGYLIEKISGQSFNDYSKEVLLKPLEMNSSGWYIKEIEKDSVVTLYRKNNSGEIKAINPLYSWPGYSDGNLRANLEEASNFLIMILSKGSYNGKQILKPETVNEMLRPQGIKNLPPGYLKDMGLVWDIGALPNNNTIYLHTGEPAGTIVAMMFNPETNSGFVTALTGIKFNSQEDGAKWVAYLVYLMQQSAS